MSSEHLPIQGLHCGNPNKKAFKTSLWRRSWANTQKSIKQSKKMLQMEKRDRDFFWVNLSIDLSEAILDYLAEGPKITHPWPFERHLEHPSSHQFLRKPCRFTIQILHHWSEHILVHTWAHESTSYFIWNRPDVLKKCSIKLN